MSTLPVPVPAAQLSAEAADLLARCESCWPHPPERIGRVLHLNGADVKDYLRDGMGSGDREWLVDAIQNAKVAIGDACVECGEDIGDEGSGSFRCCSRQCERAYGEVL